MSCTRSGGTVDGGRARSWRIQRVASPCLSAGSRVRPDPRASPSVASPPGIAQVDTSRWWSAGMGPCGQSSAVPAPAGVRLSSRLTSVSCTSPTACTAVGESASPDGTTPLVERWNGTTWSIERATGGSLISVSCTSRLACTAVGRAGNETLGEGWNGSRWSIQPNPHPRGFGGPGGANELGSVFCASSDACIAVGDSGWGSGFNSVRVTLAESWNGSDWSVAAHPESNPARRAQQCLLLVQWIVHRGRRLHGSSRRRDAAAS